MFKVEDGFIVPPNPKEAKVEAARNMYKAGGITKTEAAKRVIDIDGRSGFINTEPSSAIQYIVRRI